MRYINNIELQESDLTNWQKYINSDLLPIFSFYEDKKVLSRIINHIELSFEDLSFKFQSGMRNPDYPAPIRRKMFVLDYDCHSEVLINDIGDLEIKLDKSHKLIVQMFEKSITEELRSLMNE